MLGGRFSYFTLRIAGVDSWEVVARFISKIAGGGSIGLPTTS
jgi:hypothetical protein